MNVSTIITVMRSMPSETAQTVAAGLLALLRYRPDLRSELAAGDISFLQAFGRGRYEKACETCAGSGIEYGDDGPVDFCACGGLRYAAYIGPTNAFLPVNGQKTDYTADRDDLAVNLSRIAEAERLRSSGGLLSPWSVFIAKALADIGTVSSSTPIPDRWQMLRDDKIADEAIEATLASVRQDYGSLTLSQFKRILPRLETVKNTITELVQ